jgi:L-asparaginase II
VGVPGAELGIALKVEDGAQRGAGPAIIALLRELDLISEDDLGRLHTFVYPEIVNTRGEAVGQLRPSIRLVTPDA